MFFVIEFFKSNFHRLSSFSRLFVAVYESVQLNFVGFEINLDTSKAKISRLHLWTAPDRPFFPRVATCAVVYIFIIPTWSIFCLVNNHGNSEKLNKSSNEVKL